MSFTNIQVALSDLPTFENIEFNDIDPSYARLLCSVALVVEGVIAGIGITIWLFVDIPPTFQEQTLSIWGSVLSLMAILDLYLFKAARAIKYSIRAHDLVLKSGLFWRKEVIQPIRRIQHVELKRGPLEKRMGLASISLFSAGTSGATFTIPGLRLITAARIRRYVLHTDRL
ncbi:MAG: PH domain-containing protein [Gammaproteobacteria bacterium]|nr:PH domain-containing protein [Gammaproteobacteria bacterium]MCZ6855020.1 PH domain-containing protein [Gammaproteobacteria bacterium]